MVCSLVVASRTSRLVMAIVGSLDEEALRDACFAVESQLPPQMELLLPAKGKGEGGAGSVDERSTPCCGFQYEAAAAALYRVATGCPGAVIETGGVRALMHILAMPVARVEGTASHLYALEAVLQLIRSEPSAAGEFVQADGMKLLINLIHVDSLEQSHVKRKAMRLLAVLLRDLSLRAANCEAAMKTGVAPVLVQVLHHTPDEVQMSEAATLLRELVDMPQCADSLLRQHIIDGLVFVIRDRKHVESNVRREAASVLAAFARTRSAGLRQELEIGASRSLVQLLRHGTEAEVEVAEEALLDIAASPSGAYYVHRAGCVAAICSILSKNSSQYHQRRGCRLIRVLTKCHDALDDLMQPSIITALNGCLKAGSPKSQRLACSTLLLLLRQCSAAMATRARRLIPALIYLVREPACALEVRREAASCLERLTRERGVRELVVAAGAIGAVVRLLEDPADLQTCAWGVMLARNLALGHPGVSSAFLRTGIVRQMVVLLNTALGPQVVAALYCLNHSGRFSQSILDAGTVPHLVNLLVATERTGEQRPAREMPCPPHCEHCLDMCQNAWRTKCLTAKLLADLLAPWLVVDDATAEKTACAIPPLVQMLAAAQSTSATPSFVDDLVDYYGSGADLLNPPSSALLAIASRSASNKTAVLEELALRAWMGQRARVGGLEYV